MNRARPITFDSIPAQRPDGASSTERPPAGLPQPPRAAKSVARPLGLLRRNFARAVRRARAPGRRKTRSGRSIQVSRSTSPTPLPRTPCRDSDCSCHGSPRRRSQRPLRALPPGHGPAEPGPSRPGRGSSRPGPRRVCCR